MSDQLIVYGVDGYFCPTPKNVNDLKLASVPISDQSLLLDFPVSSQRFWHS